MRKKETEFSRFERFMAKVDYQVRKEQEEHKRYEKYKKKKSDTVVDEENQNE